MKYKGEGGSGEGEGPVYPVRMHKCTTAHPKSPYEYAFKISYRTCSRACNSCAEETVVISDMTAYQK